MIDSIDVTCQDTMLSLLMLYIRHSANVILRHLETSLDWLLLY